MEVEVGGFHGNGDRRRGAGDAGSALRSHLCYKRGKVTNNIKTQHQKYKTGNI